ncbi:Y-family DNA polymerase [Dermabacter vaginalis]|uniref:Y-family DNA polymerase n=1 Tax=Dermabacter vaginalis TaxID=1630135 RepID=UPI0021A2D4DE|nr:Y-family DNA polymerase [Dermabacter vaginalis]MCT2149826.1 Y-family DNA polymerase [Dermabacter vaginalis]
MDAESFYASCEAAFDPKLRGKPIVVLSNNDGCVVAANALAKRIDPGIMFKPYFQIQNCSLAKGVAVRSSNYELYGAVFNRISEIISLYSAWQEVYSVDESFVGLRGTPGELETIGREIRRTVRLLTGVPVRVAIGATKSLAKVAATGIKKTFADIGVLHLARYTDEQMDRILDSIPVTDLWGVAERSGKRLAAINIHTARELQDMDPKWARKRFNVNMERTVLELRGIPCIPLEMVPPAAKDQLTFSRSYAKKITTEPEMEQVISLYAPRASARLRGQGSVAGHLSAWAATGWADDGTVGHPAHATMPLITSTDDSITLTKAARALLPKLFPVPGIRYARAGVVLTDLRQAYGVQPLDLFRPEFEGRGVGRAFDEINRKFATTTVGIGLGGMKASPGWEMKRELLSLRCRTNWASYSLRLLDSYADARCCWARSSATRARRSASRTRMSVTSETGR